MATRLLGCLLEDNICFFFFPWQRQNFLARQFFVTRASLTVKTLCRSGTTSSFSTGINFAFNRHKLSPASKGPAHTKRAMQAHHAF
jgi:hypothetical protein